MKRLFGATLLTLALAVGAGAAEQPERWNLETLTKEGRVSFGQGGLAQGSGGVLVHYWNKDGKQTELSASKIQLNQATGDIKAEGAIFLQNDGRLWRGEQLEIGRAHV